MPFCERGTRNFEIDYNTPHTCIPGLGCQKQARRFSQFELKVGELGFPIHFVYVSAALYHRGHTAAIFSPSVNTVHLPQTLFKQHGCQQFSQRNVPKTVFLAISLSYITSFFFSIFPVLVHPHIGCKAHTVNSCIQAAAYVHFLFNFLVRLSFKCDFYLRMV